MQSLPERVAALKPSVFERVGGLPAFVALVDGFYARIESDPPIRRVYPEDLGPGKQALAEFLAQYFGGGNIYSDTRGHPRLRMRHGPFEITPDGARRWMAHMSEAIRAADYDPEATALMLEYVTTFAPHMVNQPDPQLSPPGTGLPTA